jgi:D-sedoheptulose 7-phosphate isomerase
MNQAQGSDFDRLFYPFLFEGGQVDAKDVLAQVCHSTLEKCQETITLRRATLELGKGVILAAGLAMARAFAGGATLFAFGNGGSATDTQDIVVDLTLPQYPSVPALPAIALNNDSAVITGVANDVGFENIYTRQIIAFGRPGDIALGISTSGNSKNILSAFEQAHKQGLLTIGLAGYDGGKMNNLDALDFCIIAPGDHIPRIQEAQATVYHILIEIVHTYLTPKSPITPSTQIHHTPPGR